MEYMQYTNPFNSFNSWKVMFHINRMKAIRKAVKSGNPSFLPPPVFVTVDPSNACCHDCPWCISSDVKRKDSTIVSRDILLDLARLIGVGDLLHLGGEMINAVAIAGGGEPLMNKNCSEFMRILGNNTVELSLLTNGEMLNDETIECLARYARWVGFSVDAGDADTHSKMHRSRFLKINQRNNTNSFEKVLSNIKKLSVTRDKFRAAPHHARQFGPLRIGYKFNLHPDNFRLIPEAARAARDSGCDEILFRPTHITDYELFEPIIDLAKNYIVGARHDFENDRFKVYGVLHKFGNNWEAVHDFDKCLSTPLGLVFSSDGNMYMCCDRRGDTSLSLGRWHDGKRVLHRDIENAWRSEKHLRLINDIVLNDCPRCSMRFYNKLMNEALDRKDPMTSNFL